MRPAGVGPVRLLRVAGTGGQREPGWAAAPGAFSVYRFIWAATRADQVRLCLVTLLVVPVSMVPLELQRRVVHLGTVVIGERPSDRRRFGAHLLGFWCPRSRTPMWGSPANH